jgi:hypothetical protein
MRAVPDQRVKGDRGLNPRHRRADIFGGVAIETFMTELSSVIKNCAEASVSSTALAPRPHPRAAAGPTSVSRLTSI